jgi:hypothetical protein
MTHHVNRLQSLLSKIDQALDDVDCQFPIALDIGTRQGQQQFITIQSATEAALFVDGMRYARALGPLPAELSEF